MYLKTKTFSYDTRTKAFWSLVSICLLSILVYIYAVISITHNTVARKSLESQVSVLSSQTGQLEFSYIALQNKVTLDVAYALGFKDVATEKYISRTNTNSLSINLGSSGTLNP